MITCRCTSLVHPNHRDRVCENLASDAGVYCRACGDLVAQEAASVREPSQDMVPRKRKTR